MPCFELGCTLPFFLESRVFLNQLGSPVSTNNTSWVLRYTWLGRRESLNSPCSVWTWLFYSTLTLQNDLFIFAVIKKWPSCFISTWLQNRFTLACGFLTVLISQAVCTVIYIFLVVWLLNAIRIYFLYTCDGFHFRSSMSYQLILYWNLILGQIVYKNLYLLFHWIIKPVFVYSYSVS